MSPVPVRASLLAGAGLLALCGTVRAQTAPSSPHVEPAHIVGRVSVPDGGPAPGTVLMLDGRARGMSDPAGAFHLGGVLPGNRRLSVLAAGYRLVELELGVRAGDTIRVDLLLEADPIGVDGITVTGTMQHTSRSRSPVRVEIVPASVLQRTATNSLMEAIQFQNGISTQVDCGVCYTNSIRINGMDGPYTAVLIDGMPIMGALASVYGLNGINPALVERVEIVKGPSSTLYGSEAMGGVVNVITRDPRFAPRMAADVSATSHGEWNVDVGTSRAGNRVAALLSGNVAWNDHFLDANGDGFSDIPLTRRAVVFGKLDVGDGGTPVGAVSFRYVDEDRFGGMEAWGPSLRGSGEIYGESILTQRLEVMGSYRLREGTGLRVDGSYTWHDQDAWYGSTRYAARQDVGFGTLVWSGSRDRHDLLVGVTARYQGYDDSTPATPEVDRSLVPGVFVQSEIRAGEGFTLLAGSRLDHHRAHGLIPSPRMAVKWDAARRTALRLNAGTGFRVVNLFTEDHAALTGSREVVIRDELAPERSWSVAANLNQVVEFGPNPMMVDVDLFFTRFSNRIVAQYDVHPSQIVYDNLAGHAAGRGLSISVNQNVDFDRFLWTAGLTLQETYTVEGDHREATFFSPRVRGTLGATWRPTGLPLRFDYTATVTGPMRLPAYDPPHERATRSPVQGLHILQGTWTGFRSAEAYLTVRNVFDSRQPSPLVAPDDPFAEAFDTAWVYGPLRGRHFLAGLRWGVGR